MRLEPDVSDTKFETKTERKTTTALLSRYIKDLNPDDVKACIAVEKNRLNSPRNLQFIFTKQYR